MLKQGELVILENCSIEIIKFLGKGKGGYSYLAKWKNEEIVYKQIHYEPCEYYTFGNKILSEVEAYKRLLEVGVKIPKLLEYSENKNYIMKEYIDGSTAAELASENLLNENHFAELFKMAAMIYEKNMNIDFFPTNFICKGEELFYIDYECNDFTEEWNLENWGIYFWLNSEGIKEMLDTGRFSKLCLPDSQKPVKEKFEKRALKLIKKYGN